MDTLPASKKDVETIVEKAVDTLASMIGEGCSHNDTRLNNIEDRLDRIENLLLEEQKRDIEDLKRRMKRLEDVMAV